MSGIFRYNTTSSTPNRRATLSPFCTSPGQLQDVTMDNSYALGYRSPCLSIQHGGSTSPGQGRSVREFEEQIASLRKENFNLKLRIYFLEEKIPGYSSPNTDGHESLMKQNVDLKVDIEVLRKELQEKQSLLGEAAKAMELMEDQQKAIEQKSQGIIDELNQKIHFYEMESKELEKSSSGHTLEQLMGRTDIAGDVDVLQKIRELEGFVKQYEQKTEELSGKIKELEDLIEQKDHCIQETSEQVKQLMFQKAELQEQLDNKKQVVSNEHHPKLREELHEHKKIIADKICLIEDIETKLKDKTVAHDQACKAVKKLLLNTTELQSEIERLKNMTSSQDVSQLKEDTTNTLNSNSNALCKSSNEPELELSDMKAKLEKIIEIKDAEISKLQLEVKKKTANLQNLVNKELWEKNKEIERLIKLLGKSNVPKSLPCSPVREIDQLQQSFADSDNSKTLGRNKHLQKNTDSIIEQLRSELNDAREETENAHRWRKGCADVCAVLTARLEELAGFLDTLLKQKDIIGALAADRRRAMRKAIDKSLDLSRSLNNISMSVRGISFSENSFAYMSNISFLMNQSTENKENKTIYSYENENSQIIEDLKAEVKALKKELDKRKLSDPVKKDRRSLPLLIALDNQSESEAWSEPDRNVSFARIGLEEPFNISKQIMKINDESMVSSTESDTDINRKCKSKSHEKTSQLELLVSERDNRILSIQCELVEADNRLKKETLRMIDMKRELEEYKKVNEMLEIEIANYKFQGNEIEKITNDKDTLRRQLNDKDHRLTQVTEDRDKLNVELRLGEMKIKTLKTDLEEIKQTHERKLNSLIDDEKQKLQQLQNELTIKYENKLKEQERIHKEYLSRDWISRSFYEDTKRELDDAQKKLNEAEFTIHFMNENETELNSQLVENEKSVRNLKKNLDEATLQASRAVLERTKILNEKLQLEGKIQELTNQLAANEQDKYELTSRLQQLENSNTLLHNKLLNNSTTNAQYKIINNRNSKKSQQSNGSDGQSGYTSEDVPMGPPRAGGQRLDNSSPDLGIESDAGRTSSVDITSSEAQLLHTNKISNSAKNILEENHDDITNLTADNNQTDVTNNNNGSNIQQNSGLIRHDCAKVDQENAELRRKLVRTWNKLRTSNQRKEQIERDIKQQILKTQNVLRNVRTNMESELEQPKKE